MMHSNDLLTAGSIESLPQLPGEPRTEKVRIGIVGLGFGLKYMSRLVKKELGNLPLEVRAVCDTSATAPRWRRDVQLPGLQQPRRDARKR